MRPTPGRLRSPLAALVALATAALACFTLPACGDEAEPALTKKGSGGKGGGTGGSGTGAAGAGGKAPRTFEVAGACTARQMPVEIDGKVYPIDCDVWRGPDAVFRVFDALDKCCTAADRQNPLYPNFTPQGKLVYQIIAVLHQEDAENDFITVDLPGTVACETAVNAALPKIAMCQGGVDINAVLSACTSFVFGKLPEGEKCPDTDSCVSPASCIGANSTTKANGTCRAPGQLNAGCANGLEQPKNGTPQHPLCAPGFVCSSDRCVAQIADGGDCTFDLSCVSGRCAAKKCAPALPQKIAIGGQCAGATDCQPGLRCFGGVCADKLAGGETCAPQGDECRVFCDNGKCAAQFCGIDRF